MPECLRQSLRRLREARYRYRHQIGRRYHRTAGRRGMPDHGGPPESGDSRCRNAYAKVYAAFEKRGIDTVIRSEGDIIELQVDEVCRTTGVRPKAVTADAGMPTPKSTPPSRSAVSIPSSQLRPNQSARAFLCDGSPTIPRTTS